MHISIWGHCINHMHCILYSLQNQICIGSWCRSRDIYLQRQRSTKFHLSTEAQLDYISHSSHRVSASNYSWACCKSQSDKRNSYYFFWFCFRNRDKLQKCKHALLPTCIIAKLPNLSNCPIAELCK